MKKTIKKSKIVNKYIFTSVIPNAKVIKSLLKTLEFYCKKEKAELFVMSTKLLDKDSLVDADLFAQYMHKGDWSINKDYKVYDYHVRHIVANPISGLTYFEKTAIIPAPRLLMESLPRQIKKTTIPRAIWTTGTICEADPMAYDNSKSQQKSRTTHRETGIGALVVEEYDNGLCNVRHLEWKKGCLYDFVENKKLYKYTENKKEEAVSEAMIVGDRHLGHTDMTVSKQVDKMIESSKPKRIYEHDLVDGMSKYIHHHTVGNQIAMAQNEMTPEKELKLLIDFLQERQEKFPESKTFIVPSNHNDFYDRFLQDKNRVNKFLDQIKEEFYKHPDRSDLEEIMNNILILKELYESKYNKKQPLEEYCKKRMSLKNLKFIKKGENSHVKNWECGNHGDAGVNGSRGGWQRLVYNSNIFGHTHTTKRTSYAIWTGVLERIDADYCDPNGFSTWTYAVVNVYPNGAVQQILIFNNDLEQFYK